MKKTILVLTGNIRKKKEGKVEEKIIKKIKPCNKIIFLHLRDNNMCKGEMVSFFKRHEFCCVILKDCHTGFLEKLSSIIKDQEIPLIPVKGEEECTECLENIIKGVV